MQNLGWGRGGEGGKQSALWAIEKMGMTETVEQILQMYLPIGSIGINISIVE